MTPAATGGIVLSVNTPRLHERTRTTLPARLRSWLGAAALVAVVGAAIFYGVTVNPSLLPANQRSFTQPPYRSDLDALTALAEGKARAAESGKMLMVTFGANWCPDCVALDVGDAKKNAAVQRDLGISVNVIPLAVFYSAAGELVGDTYAGQLKPSRHFSSREIRDFLREVVDYHRIVSPDQRQ